MATMMMVTRDLRFFCVISGFGCDVDEICALLAYYAALTGSSVRTFRNIISVPSSRVKKPKKKAWASFLDFLTLENGTDMMFRNVFTELPFNSA
jgi:hypothetical protein